MGLSIRWRPGRKGKEFASFQVWCEDRTTGVKKLRYENLPMRLWRYTSPANETERTFNREVDLKAKEYKALRELEILRTGGYTKTGEHEKQKNFFYIYDEAMNERTTNRSIWERVRELIVKAIGGDFLAFEKLNNDPAARKRFYNGCTTVFKETVGPMTAATYENVLRCALRAAYRSELLKTDICTLMRPVCKMPKRKNPDYLREGEIAALCQTECIRPEVKKMFLFSLLTGMRRGDLWRLTWNDITTEGKQRIVRFTQHKTGAEQEIILTDKAWRLIDTKTKRLDGFVFALRKGDHGMITPALRQWAKSAGVKRRVHFHLARKTAGHYAKKSAQGSYAAQRLLGHATIKTTELAYDGRDYEDTRAGAEEVAKVVPL